MEWAVSVVISTVDCNCLCSAGYQLSVDQPIELAGGRAHFQPSTSRSPLILRFLIIEGLCVCGSSVDRWVEVLTIVSTVARWILGGRVVVVPVYSLGISRFCS